ncbi:hypothetical protein HYV74_04115 [Candidatus Uhrbacteria bacterium]|nr:hypothetical protein [Candidatus Uhrbacteria bacterium]
MSHESNKRKRHGIPTRIRRENVERIYRDADGNLPDFTRLDRRPPTWRRWAIAGSLVALAMLAVAAWTSFLLFKPYAVSSGSDVLLTIDAPSAVGFGEETTYRVTLTNNDRVPLASSSIELRLPGDFRMITALPTPDDTHTLRWTLGTIPDHGHKTIEVRGQIFGAPANSVVIDALAIYRPANFNADFQTTASASTVLGASPIALSIEGPTEILPRSPVTYTLTYEHLGERILPPMQVTVDAPRTFVLTSAKPERARKDLLQWSLGELPPNAKGTIILTGNFTDGGRDPITLRATALLKTTNDHSIALASTETSTMVVGGDVAVVATANDQATALDVHAGDTLRFRSTIRNDGTKPLQGVTVHAILEAPAIGDRSILNFNHITDTANGIAIGEQLGAGRRRGTITWTATEIPALTTIPPGEQRQIDFVLPLHTTESLPGFPTKGTITFRTTVDIATTGTTPARTVPSNTLTMQLRDATTP